MQKSPQWIDIPNVKDNLFITVVFDQAETQAKAWVYTAGAWMPSIILELRPDYVLWPICLDKKLNPPKNAYFRLDSVNSKLGIELEKLQKHRKQTPVQQPGKFELSKKRGICLN